MNRHTLAATDRGDDGDFVGGGEDMVTFREVVIHGDGRACQELGERRNLACEFGSQHRDRGTIGHFDANGLRSDMISCGSE